MRLDGAWRLAVATMMLALAFAFVGRGVPGTGTVAAQDKTPTAAYSCDPATPAAGDDTGGMGMMIPHHQSIVALSQAARPRLVDERPRSTAQAIIDARTMEEMAVQMGADAQVAAFRVAEHAGVAFIEMGIPHHEMALAASEAAVEQATHEEVRSFAERVIEDQEREIDALTVILVDISGAHHSHRPGRTAS